jgi:hypothetical protein
MQLRCLALLGCALAACGLDFEARCGDVSGNGACVTVMSVEPYYGVVLGATSNVDAFQDTCVVPDPAQPGQTMVIAEPFTDHAALVTLRNEPPPDYRHQPDLAPTVQFDRLHIAYTLNQCPEGAVCPAIEETDLLLNSTIAVAGGSTVTTTLPLMPLRYKQAYEGDGATPGAYPSYTAQYRFRGAESSHQDNTRRSVTLYFNAEFTIGNFDYCPAVD